MHEGERERSPDHAREIVQYATLSHIYSYTGIARVLLCHGRKLSRIATCLNCDSRDEYYGLVGYRGCIRGYYLHRKVWQTALANFVLSESVHFSIASTLAVARGFAGDVT